MVHTHLLGLRFLSKHTSQECWLADILSQKKKKNHVKTTGRNIKPLLQMAPPLCVFNTKADGFKQQESSLGRLQEEVLDTAGLPDLQGGATLSTFIHNSDSNINAKWLKANPAPRKGERWGSGGASGRGGDGEKERGQIPGEQILTDLLHLCDKGNNSFR